jgi:flagellar biosynthesis protein FliQ
MPCHSICHHQNLAWCTAITMGEAGAWKSVTEVSLLILVVVHLLRTFLVGLGTGMLVSVFTRARTEPCPETLTFSPKVPYSLPSVYRYFNISVTVTFSTLSFPIGITH